jgi:hypothetical protein
MLSRKVITDKASREGNTDVIWFLISQKVGVHSLKKILWHSNRISMKCCHNKRRNICQVFHEAVSCAFRIDTDLRISGCFRRYLRFTTQVFACRCFTINFGCFVEIYLNSAIRLRSSCLLWLDIIQTNLQYYRVYTCNLFAATGWKPNCR